MRELGTIRRNVQTRIVMEVGRRVAEVALQRRSMIVVVESPLFIVHARAVHQDE